MSASLTMTTPGFLSLDVERIISQWGEGSVFSCDSEDALGDLLLHLEDEDDCDPSSLLNCIEECTSGTQYPSAAIRGGNLDLPACNAPQRLPTNSSNPPAPSHTFQPRRESSGHAAPPPAPAPQQQWQQPKMQFEAPQPGWWECTPGFPLVKDEAKPMFPINTAFSMPMQQQSHSNSRQPSCESPCIVPDSFQAAPPAQASNQFGLVPQLPQLPPPSAYLCAAPIPPPPMLHAPLLNDHMSDMMKLRQECLKRYRDKKARRMYTKMVRYQLRKINADKRPRIKGRFVKKTQEELAAAAGGASAIEGPAVSLGDASDSLVVDEGAMSDVSS